jgi:hypothetical protein
MVLIYTTTTEGLALWCLRPLSIIFQLHRGCKSFWLEKTGVSVENHEYQLEIDLFIREYPAVL